MDHPIFQTPNAVTLTLEERPTPSSYAHYPEGRQLGATMPMWRVQTEGYLDGKGQLVGIVSRDEGFLDSPDVEWISGGVNSKGPLAVALGRHGNFFHWGFAASPTYMTDEAKLVFVNAVHHIARFKGQTPIARKVQGIVIRSSIERVIDGLSDAGYAAIQAQYAQYRADQERHRASVKARIDAGEVVSDDERRSLEFPPIETPDRLANARRYVSKEVMRELGDDAARVAAYLRDNLPFMHPVGYWYELGVDGELKRLGVANDEVEFLERAIAGLSEEGSADLCQKLLERYTHEAFTTQADWQRWLDDVRPDLFFSEAAAYKWHVNRRPSAPQDAGAEAPPPEPEPSARAPLAADASATWNGDRRLEIKVRFGVLEGWHSYRDVPATSPYVPLSLELELPAGVEFEGGWTRPVGHADPHDPKLTLLSGRFTFSRTLVVDEGVTLSDPLRCTLRYQVCDEDMCMPPATETLEIQVDAPVGGAR